MGLLIGILLHSIFCHLPRVVETGLERAGLTSVSEVDTTSLILYHREQSAAAIRSAHESIYLSHVSLSVA